MIVVTGADGQLGTAFRSELGEDTIYLTREDLDLTDTASVAPKIRSISPDVLINCAAYTDVDGAESDEETANAVNGYAVGEMATVCRSIGVQFVTFSTDYVFDGEKGSPYVESDEPNPINVYGRSKLLGERLASEANPDALIVRTSWLLSGSHPNFMASILHSLEAGAATVIDDQFGTPTITQDLVNGMIETLELGATGVVHMTNRDVTSWFGLAREIATIAGFDAGIVTPCRSSDYETATRRPRNSALTSERSIAAELPRLEPGLKRCVLRQMEGSR